MPSLESDKPSKNFQNTPFFMDFRCCYLVIKDLVKFDEILKVAAAPEFVLKTTTSETLGELGIRS